MLTDPTPAIGGLNTHVNGRVSWRRTNIVFGIPSAPLCPRRCEELVGQEGCKASCGRGIATNRFKRSDFRDAVLRSFVVYGSGAIVDIFVLSCRPVSVDDVEEKVWWIVVEFAFVAWNETHKIHQVYIRGLNVYIVQLRRTLQLYNVHVLG